MRWGCYEKNLLDPEFVPALDRGSVPELWPLEIPFPLDSVSQPLSRFCLHFRPRRASSKLPVRMSGFKSGRSTDVLALTFAAESAAAAEMTKTFAIYQSCFSRAKCLSRSLTIILCACWFFTWIKNNPKPQKILAKKRGKRKFEEQRIGGVKFSIKLWNWYLKVKEHSFLDMIRIRYTVRRL